MKKLLLILTLFAITASPALADRSIDGSYVDLLSPSFPYVFTPGQPFTSEFYIFNASTDTEWISEIWLTFPACFTVTNGWWSPDAGASSPFGFGFDVTGSSDNEAYFWDLDGSWGEIYGGEGGRFYVEVMVGTGCECGPAEIDWYLQGDVYGSDPHQMTGYLNTHICEQTDTDQSDWSTIKALY